MTNAEALERAVEAFGVEPRYVPLVQLARTLAGAIDRDPGNASLAREYRNALLDLMEAADADGDDFTDLMADLASSGDETPS